MPNASRRSKFSLSGPKPLTLAVCLLITLSVSLPSRASSDRAVELYYRAADLESAASTSSQWARAAKAYLDAAEASKDPELAAAALFAAAQIFDAGAGDTGRANETFMKVILEFPNSKWAARAESKLGSAPSAGGAKNLPGNSNDNGNSEEPHNSESQAEEGSFPGNGGASYPKTTISFDPSKVTPDLFEPISPDEARDITRAVDEAAEAPHMPPEPADAVPTGDSILDTRAKNLAGEGRILEDYSLTLTLRNSKRNLTETVRVAAMLQNGRAAQFSIFFKNFQIFSGPSGHQIYFPGSGILGRPPKNSQAAEAVESIIRHLAFSLELGGARERLIAHHAGSEEKSHRIDLFFSETRGPVFFSLEINEDSLALTNFAILDFESREVIVTGTVTAMEANTGLPPENFIPPAGAVTGTIPVEFAMPPILMR